MGPLKRSKRGKAKHGHSYKVKSELPLKLTLFENAKSYLSESLEKAVAAQNDDKQWKFAIFNLVQAVELFFKERLRMEHEWLIYTDVDKRRNTVSIEKAASRLNALCQLKIKYEKGNKSKPASDLLLAVRCRNDIIHKEVFIGTEQHYLFHRILNYISNFCSLHFGLSVRDVCPTRIWNEIISDREHISEQYNTAVKLLKENAFEDIVDCPICGYPTFVLEEEINTCFTCQHKQDVYYCEDCGEVVFEDAFTRGKTTSIFAMIAM